MIEVMQSWKAGAFISSRVEPGRMLADDTRKDVDGRVLDVYARRYLDWKKSLYIVPNWQ